MIAELSRERGLVVAASATGRGLFATRSFRAGEEILEFSGRLISLAETIALGEHEGDALQVGPDRYLDLVAPGVLSNHSCAPNAGLVGDRRLRALRDLEVGEEIRWDYSTSMLERRWTMRCHCGEARCRGVVRDFDLLPADQKRRYLQAGIVSPHIVQALSSRVTGWAGSCGRALSALPEFPEFAPLSRLDRASVSAILEPFLPYSDFNYVSLRTWDLSGRTALSRLNGNLVARLDDYASGEPFLTVLGTREVSASASELLSWAGQNGVGRALRRVPEETVAALDGDEGEAFSIEEEIDSADYVHRVSDLIALPGRRFERRRRGIRRFCDAHPGHSVELLNVAEPATREAIENLLARWWSARASSVGDQPRDLRALRRCLDSELLDDLVIVGVEDRGEMLGFTINEKIHAGYFMAHFVRAEPGVQGLSEVLEHETAKVMNGLGCEWMNYQEDMGIPGLRAWKRSWNPVAFLRKFEVRRA